MGQLTRGGLGKPKEPLKKHTSLIEKPQKMPSDFIPGPAASLPVGRSTQVTFNYRPRVHQCNSSVPEATKADRHVIFLTCRLLSPSVAPGTWCKNGALLV